MRAAKTIVLLLSTLALAACSGTGPSPAPQSGHSGMNMDVQPKELARLPAFAFQGFVWERGVFG